MKPHHAKAKKSEPVQPAAKGGDEPATPVSDPPATLTSRSRYLTWVLVALVVLFTVSVRLRLLEMPLERDEGEYAYAGQLMLHGVPPYKLAYNMKFPGTYAMYAASMAAFGENVAGVHLGLLVVNAASILLLFLLGRQWFDARAGAMAAASFGVLSISSKVLGLAAHATHFVVLAMLGAMVLLLKAGASGRRGVLFGSGLLFGAAFLMKQHGVFFVLFGGIWMVWEELKQSPRSFVRLCGRTALFSAGFVLPFLLACGGLWMAGVLGVFWQWTVQNAWEYVSGRSISEGATLLAAQARAMGTNFWPLGMLVLVGLVLIWRRKVERERAVFLTVFFICSILTVCPGWYFRDHYFITLLPAISLLAGAGVSCLHQEFGGGRWSVVGRYGLPVVAMLALGFGVWEERRLLFQLKPDAVCQTIYGTNPVIESREIARYIREQTEGDARVAVVGSEPQIYFYAGRRSATRFIYTYGLVRDLKNGLKMQEQMISEIETAKPEYFVFVNVPVSWAVLPEAPKKIFEWTYEYIHQHYELVGIADMIGPGANQIRWDAALDNYERRSKFYIAVLRRKSQ